MTDVTEDPTVKAARIAAAYARAVAIDTDSAFAANSDTVVASQKATKTALGLKASIIAGSAVYGTGVDGSPTFDGSTTILGMAPSSSIYTLTRDIFLASPIINSGVTLKPAGFRIFVNGILTNNGTIACDGANAVNQTGGAVAAVTGPVNNSGFTGIGGNGSTGAGSAGASPVNTAQGANGGAGGANGGTAGGAGGTAGSSSIYGNWKVFSNAITMACITNGGANTSQGGAGGGGGGGDATNQGGGGGGGGGVIFMAVYTWAGTGAVHARGGTGASPAAGNTGGGGGGGGGCVAIVSDSISSGAIAGQTIDAAGGTHGTAHGTGSNGVDGTNGNVYLFAN